MPNEKVTKLGAELVRAIGRKAHLDSHKKKNFLDEVPEEWVYMFKGKRKPSEIITDEEFPYRGYYRLGLHDAGDIGTLESIHYGYTPEKLQNLLDKELDKQSDIRLREDFQDVLDSAISRSVRNNFNRGSFTEDETRNDVIYMLKSGADPSDVLDLLNGKIDYVPLK